MKANVFFIKITILVATLCWLDAAGAKANGGNDGGSAEKCKAGVFPKYFLAGFAVSNPSQKEWIWNKNWDHHIDKNTYAMGYDYSWVVEPGNMENGIFKPSKYAFAQGHWNTYYLGKGEDSGTIADLISTIKFTSYVYLNDPDPGKREDSHKKTGDLPVHIEQYDNNVIALYSYSPEALELLFSDHPEYEKMTMKTPYPSQSYTCITKIHYNE